LNEVTEEASNTNLDVGRITLEKPTPEEAEQGLVYYAEVSSNLGAFPVDIFQSENPECLEIRVHKYLILNPRVAAQVLRYAETQCVLTKESAING
jgi:hypothetical protein